MKKKKGQMKYQNEEERSYEEQSTWKFILI